MNQGGGQIAALVTKREIRSLCYARLFAKHFMRSPDKMGDAEVRCFLLLTDLIVAARRTPS